MKVLINISWRSFALKKIKKNPAAPRLDFEFKQQY
jgi:hypothetical protein